MQARSRRGAILAGSGDPGVIYGQNDSSYCTNPRTGQVPQLSNGSSGGLAPSFSALCPCVTSVGVIQAELNSEFCGGADETRVILVAASASIFAMPAWQKASVNKFSNRYPSG